MTGRATSGDGVGLRVLGILLYAYPGAFRRNYGDPLLQALRDGLEEARTKSLWQRFVFWHRAARNVTTGGLRMRLRSALGRNDSSQPANQPGGPDRWAWRQLDILRTDLTQAFRSLFRSPVMTAATILMLAVAIGLITLTFSVVYATTIRDLPYPGVDRLVEIDYWGEPVDGRPMRAGSGFDPQTLGDVSRIFSAIGEFDEQQVPLDDGTGMRLALGATVSPGLFELLGVYPQMGRTFTAEDAIPGAPATVVLGHDLWTSRFDGQRDILGQSIRIGDAVHTVIGVMPEGFGFSYYARLWLPHDRERRFGTNRIDGGVVARLRDGVSIEQANVELEMRRVQLREAGVRPFDDPSEGFRYFLQAKPLGWERWDELGWQPYSALVPVGLALLVACANVAGLLLARGAARRHEMTLRVVLGGSRSRLVGHLLAESLLIAACAGSLGLLSVYWSSPLITRIAEQAFDDAFPFGLPQIGIESFSPAWLRLTPDTTVALFAFGASLLVVAFIGLVPAREGSRPDLGAALRAAGYGTTAGRRSRRWMKTLSVAQIALSIVLVVGASLTLQSSLVLQNFDPGIDVDRGLELRIGPAHRGPQAAREDVHLANVKLRALERIAAQPDVESASSVWYADRELLRPRSLSRIIGSSFVNVAGPTTLQAQRGIFGRAIGPDYFRTLGIEIVEGRGLQEIDDRAARLVAVISESTARIGWPGENPIGREIRLREDGPGYTVVGVVEDMRRSDYLLEASRPQSWRHVYVPSEQVGVAPDYLVVRARSDPRAIAEKLRRIVHEFDPTVSVTIQPLNSWGQEAFMSLVLRWSTRLLAAIGISALVLAALGIFSVVSYATVRRTREMGLRCALGADRSVIIRLVLADSFRLVAVGLAAGIGAAAAVGKLLAGLLHGVSPFSPLPYIAVVAAVVFIATLAGWQPARRAARIDPAVALRED